MSVVRWSAYACLGVALLTLGGCFETLASAFLAPETLAVQGASTEVQALANDAGTNLDQLGAMGNTASEVDQLLTNYPDAANRGELSALRSQLGSSSAASSAAKTPFNGSIRDTADKRSRFDRRVTLTKDNSRSTSDTMLIKPHVWRRHNGDQLQATIEPTDLSHWQLPSYQIARNGG